MGVCFEDECLDCFFGFYCEGYSNLFVIGFCVFGYYCFQGFRVNVFMFFGFLCFRVYYCFEGIVDLKECELGRLVDKLIFGVRILGF